MRELRFYDFSSSSSEKGNPANHGKELSSYLKLLIERKGVILYNKISITFIFLKLIFNFFGGGEKRERESQRNKCLFLLRTVDFFCSYSI